MATTSLGSQRKQRWVAPLVGIGALCLASAGVALVTTRHYRSWQAWSTTVGAEPEPPRSTAPLPAIARPATAVSMVTTAAVPPPAPAPAPLEAPLEAPPAYADDDSVRMPQPIVLHVEPTVELNAPAPAPSTAPSPSASASTAAAAPAAPAASATPEIVTCGSTTCGPGKVCCNPHCGICANPGELCSQFICGMPSAPASALCGPATCNVGEVCCNASCGVCVRPGESCDATRRCSGEITAPESQSCGMQTCNVGLVCCNPSCGICAPPGEKCSDRVCG